MEYQDITVLLVDDDYDHANLFKANLQRKGITSEVKHFGNSFTLGKYLFDKNIDHQKYNYLMVLDTNIPGLDCQKLLSNIKNQPTLDNIVIIALTEKDSNTNKDCNATLSKPLIQKVFEETRSNLNILIQNCKISCTKKLVMIIPNK